MNVSKIKITPEENMMSKIRQNNDLVSEKRPVLRLNLDTGLLHVLSWDFTQDDYPTCCPNELDIGVYHHMKIRFTIDAILAYVAQKAQSAGYETEISNFQHLFDGLDMDLISMLSRPTSYYLDNCPIRWTTSCQDCSDFRTCKVLRNFLTFDDSTDDDIDDSNINY